MTQVIFDQVRDPLPDCSSALEPLQYRFGHFRATIGVAVERDTIGFLAKANRLSDIVQEAAVRQGFRRLLEMAQSQKRVLEDIALRMVLRALLNALHLFDLRQQDLQQTCFVQQLESPSRTAFSEDPSDLLADSFGRNLCDHWRRLLDGIQG